jgi:ATP-dependent RNA helicase RhlE
LIATPGRLLDHLAQRTVDLSHVEILVLDEADRMLDMGFLPSIKRVLGYLPKQNRQTMLFSATFAPEIRELAKQFLKNPVEVQVAPQNSTTAQVIHRMHPVSSSDKKNLLIELLRVDSRQQTLIFSRTKHGADKLAKALGAIGFRTAAIHGNKSQGARTRALADFKSGVVTHLIATDIAARGLDIKELPVVYNFDMPQVAEDYVHRIGRTGRAGASGIAISLVSHEERGQLRDIEKLTKRTFELVPVAGFAVNMTPITSPGNAPVQRPRQNHVQTRGQNPGQTPGQTQERRTNHGSARHASGQPRPAGTRHGQGRGQGTNPNANGRTGTR